MLRSIGSSIAVLAALLVAGAAPASARDICVAPATGCTESAPTITAALTAAGSASDADTIRLGAATYTENGLVRSATGGPLTIVGAGQGQTVVRRVAPAAATTVLSLPGTAAVNLSKLTIRITGTSLSSLKGVESDALSGLIEDVGVDDLGASNNNTPVALRLTGGATARNVSLTLANTVSGICVESNNAGVAPTTVTSSLLSCPTGFNIQAGTVKIARSTVTSAANGVNVGSVGSASLEDSVVWMRAGSGVGTGLSIGTSSSSPATITARHTTIVGNGNAGGKGADCFSFAGTGGGAISLTDSVVTGFDIALSSETNSGSGRSCAITADYLAKPAGSTAATGTAATVSVTHETNAAPGFLNAATGDFRLGPASGLLDKDPAPLGVDESTIDRIGTARVVGGARDLGAYERPAAAVAALGATAITETGATLAGSVNTGGATGSAMLAYGRTAEYDHSIPVELGAQTAAQAVTQALTGLDRDASYHAVLVLTTPYGVVSSGDITFRTAAPPIVDPIPPVVVTPPVVLPPVAKKTCKVPKLTGLTVVAARKALSKAGCATGRITKPKKPKKLKKGEKYVVRTQSRKAGTKVALKTKVALTLRVKAAPKPKKTPARA